MRPCWQSKKRRNAHHTVMSPRRTHQAFPNAEFVAKMASLDPDLLAFTGEPVLRKLRRYNIIRTPVDKAIVDYLRKWYMDGWTWRELMRDRPCVSLPDDHDVYQGNLWGDRATRAGPKVVSGFIAECDSGTLQRYTWRASCSVAA